MKEDDSTQEPETPYDKLFVEIGKPGFDRALEMALKHQLISPDQAKTLTGIAAQRQTPPKIDQDVIRRAISRLGGDPKGKPDAKK